MNGEKSYEDGVRDGELKALVGRVASLESVVIDGFKIRDIKITALEHAIWLLYGAIGIVGFIVPIAQRVMSSGG